LLHRIHELADQEEGVDLVRSGNPRTTLERLFLRETVQRDAEAGPGSGTRQGSPADGIPDGCNNDTEEDSP
ncbi:MAG: hypothetical protein VYA27_09815, partial [Verrucomicrobiota bacterium]|nr:hypothetical protein [Verrucomicrobiota bacterium]